MTDLTIKELHGILTELIDQGHGDKEFQIFYDGECVYTTIEKGSPIRFIGNGVRFTDYRWCGMTYYCPVCRTPLIRIAEYTFYCLNCEKKVGALIRDTKENGNDWKTI